MFDFMGIVGLIGFLVFIVLAIVSALRKTGKAKKQLIIAGILFVVFFVGATASGTSSSEESTSEASKKSVAETEKEEKKEKKIEIAPSTVADVLAAVTAGMKFDDYLETKDAKLNVEQPESLSIGNGNVGNVLQATDGFVVVATDGATVLSVETFASMDEAKAYGDKLAKEAEAVAAAEKAKKFEESKISVSGSGDTSSDLIELEAGFAVFDGSYSGSRNFIVELMDENGNNVELLVNEVGSYKGKTMAVIEQPGKYYLNVTASAGWNFSVYQTVPPELASVPTEISGQGDDVVFVNAENGNYKFTSSHQGSSNFIVQVNGTGLLVNEIGNYSGSTRQKLGTSGIYVFSVKADGNWSIKIEE